jgi:hypothetical protein
MFIIYTSRRLDDDDDGDGGGGGQAWRDFESFGDVGDNDLIRLITNNQTIKDLFLVISLAAPLR